MYCEDGRIPYELEDEGQIVCKCPDPPLEEVAEEDKKPGDLSLFAGAEVKVFAEFWEQNKEMMMAAPHEMLRCLLTELRDCPWVEVDDQLVGAVNNLIHHLERVGYIGGHKKQPERLLDVVYVKERDGRLVKTLKPVEGV